MEYIFIIQLKMYFSSYNEIIFLRIYLQSLQISIPKIIQTIRNYLNTIMIRKIKSFNRITNRINSIVVSCKLINKNSQFFSRRYSDYDYLTCNDFAHKASFSIKRSSFSCFLCMLAYLLKRSPLNF